jgi:hypothetical protein
LIIKRETDHPDADEFTFIPNTRRDTSSKAFVTRQIDMDFLRMRISPYIEKWREILGDNARALMLLDDRKSHLGEILNAWAAQHRILLYNLVPHSAHLLQPFDQGFFGRLRIQYGLFSPVKHMAKISDILERIWMAIEAKNLTRVVSNASHHRISSNGQEEEEEEEIMEEIIRDNIAPGR